MTTNHTDARTADEYTPDLRADLDGATPGDEVTLVYRSVHTDTPQTVTATLVDVCPADEQEYGYNDLYSLSGDDEADEWGLEVLADDGRATLYKGLLFRSENSNVHGRQRKTTRRVSETFGVMGAEFEAGDLDRDPAEFYVGDRVVTPEGREGEVVRLFETNEPRVDVAHDDGSHSYLPRTEVELVTDDDAGDSEPAREVVTDGGRDPADEVEAVEAAATEVDERTSCMRLAERNVEGGGSNVPDESRELARLDVLDESREAGDRIFTHLAVAEARRQGVEVPEQAVEFPAPTLSSDRGERVVYAKIPGWHVDDDDKPGLAKALGRAWGYDGHPSTVAGFAVRAAGTDDGKNGYAFTQFYDDDRNAWVSVPNRYGMAWVARSCVTLFEGEGEPCGPDMIRVRRRDGVSEDDEGNRSVEWGRALGATVRRFREGEQANPVAEAFGALAERPERQQLRVRAGLQAYVEECRADGFSALDDEEQLARVVNALLGAFDNERVRDIAERDDDDDDEGDA